MWTSIFCVGILGFFGTSGTGDIRSCFPAVIPTAQIPLPVARRWIYKSLSNSEAQIKYYLGPQWPLILTAPTPAPGQEESCPLHVSSPDLFFLVIPGILVFSVVDGPAGGGGGGGRGGVVPAQLAGACFTGGGR